MWKKPRLILDYCAQMQWKSLSTHGFWTKPYPKVEGPNPWSSDTALLFERLLDAIKGAYDSVPHTEEMPEKFRRQFSSILINFVLMMEEVQDYWFIPRLEEIEVTMQGIDKEYSSEATFLHSIIQALAGDEKRVLISVGARDGKPAWKVFKRSLVESGLVRQALYYNLGSLTYYLDQSDADLIPEPDEWLSSLGTNYKWPAVDLSKVRDLLEDAYYNQRYIVNPAGSYVRLKHFGPLKALTLKIKSPGFLDPNYVDFFCVAEFDVSKVAPERYGSTVQIKKRAFVVDGKFAQGMVDIRTPQSSTILPYLTWVIALIYHDLVTAKEVKIAGSDPLEEADKSIFIDLPYEKPSWIYIPRLIKKRSIPTRIASTPRSMKPHHVRGHLRKRSLTEQHRKELEKFEYQTGLKVLNLLDRNPGYTFVRPYIVPSIGEVSSLPNFIHARLQSEIDQMLDASQLQKGRVELSSEVK